MEGFEVFARVRPGRTSSHEPRATITKRGDIVFNAAAVSLFDASPPDYVRLLFNPDRRIVAIQRTTEDDPNSYKFRKPPRTRMRVVGAKTFLDHYGVKYDQRRHFDVYGLDDAVAFSVQETDTQHGLPRRRRQHRSHATD